MIQLIIVVTGIVSFIDAIFEKFYVWSRLQEVAANQESKFIFRLASCAFCIKFHMCVFIVSFLGLIIGFEPFFVLVPIVSSGIMYLIKK